jgi:poly(A) polymerase
MYYDPTTQVVVDYHGGFQDSKAKLLRMIGDPEVRYREDPVRIIRVLRFAAKMGYAIEPRTEAPIRSMKALLANVPASRMFDEMIKLLQTGHSLQSLAVLKKYGLERGVFPILDAHFEGIVNNEPREAFVNRALADTDRRVAEGKPVAPSFLMACIFWHEVATRWRTIRESGEATTPALQQAIDATFEARIGDISGRGKLAADMREIWMMQPRFDKRTGSAPEAMLNQPRFRAAFDFLRLRAEAGEGDKALVEWWEGFSMSDERDRQGLMEGLRKAQAQKRTEKASVRAVRAGSAAGAGAGEGGEGGGGQGGKMEILKQLAVTTRAALAEDASEDDKAAARAMFEKLGIRAGSDAQPANQRQELLQEFAQLTLAAIAPGAGQTDRAIARGMLEKLDKKANGGGRRRRGGGGRKKAAATESAASKAADDDGEIGEDFFGS